MEKGNVLQEKDDDIQRHDTQDLPSTPPPQPDDEATQDTTPKSEVNVTDWNGPDDPDNPHNWPMSTRIYHALAPALLGFAVYIAPSPYNGPANTLPAHSAHPSTHPQYQT